MIYDATELDVWDIIHIWNDMVRSTTATFTTTEKTEADITMLMRQQPVFVLKTSSSVAGFATYGPFRNGPGYSRTVEHTVYVHSDHRGQGAGRKLLVHLEGHAAAAGKRVLVGAIGGENQSGLKFHQAIGFEQVGKMPDIGEKFGRLQDLILMQKMLPNSH